MNLKTTKSLLFISIAILVFNITLFAQDKKETTIEDIGKHLSELLINREAIKESKYAINVEKLFPNEDFSAFKDSPSGFILAVLYESQQALPETWNKILLQANNFGINASAKHFETYYVQTNKDNFVLTCVIKQSSKYFIFSVTILRWEDDKYVSRIYKKIKEIKNKKELEKNLFIIVDEEISQELKEMEVESY